VGLPGGGRLVRAVRVPADFICEAIDQTRGWFYSLLAVNTLVRGTTPYRNVLCLGHIVDADGRKMSKSIGNVIDPWEILTTRGADPLRWVDVLPGLAVDADTGELRGHRLGHAGHAADPVEHLVVLHHLRVAQRLRPLGPRHPGPRRPPGARPVDAVAPRRHRRDRHHLLDGYEPFPAATAIAELIDDTSNWYVRRSRRRFWRTDPDAVAADSLGAQSTLHEVLVTVDRLLAPSARSSPTGCGAT